MDLFKNLIERIKIKRMGNIEYLRSKGAKIGENCRIYISYFGSEPWLVSVGDKVTITAGVRILTHDGSTWLFEDKNGRRELFRRVVIKNNVFIGISSIIMPGVVIENNCIIAAGSVVTKSIPEGSIVGGNPARIIGDFESLKERALENYISKNQIDFKKDYKSRILEILDPNDFKPYLKKK
jgi:acetyltransferase-like isoleucine patch superfamily enzyme